MQGIMGSYRENDVNEYRFFDAQEYISSDSDSGLGCSNCSNCSSFVFKNSQYDVWLKSPNSVKERRGNFFKQMGISLDRGFGDSDNEYSGEIGRIMENSGAVLRDSILEDNFSSNRSVQTSLSTDSFQTVRELEIDDHVAFRKCISNGVSNKRQEETARMKRFVTVTELDPCRLAKEVTQKDYVGKMADKMRSFLFRRVNSFSCITGQDSRAVSNGDSSSNRAMGRAIQKVKVRHNKKHLKELSALFKGQDITAHDGAISAMKFSPDGQYLASAGEDKIIRVWKVVENDRTREIDIPDSDPSCLYFAVNHLSQLAPLDQEIVTKPKILGRIANPTCVIFPPKIFRILEEPLHAFRQHKAKISDLSWSKNNHLLSSSMDKTVRLWQVGCDECLGIFLHSNNVTSVHFNPVNDDYFISGSIDGKVRIWEIPNHRVFDWTDFRDKVTAVCYRPDGLGGIIGFMTGNCRFFSLVDNQLQLEAVIFLTKKKSLRKRITGFQFLPKDPSKVMVVTADSRFRILCGTTVIKNVKVPRRAGNQSNAYFTSDGEHIISTSEDSNVYMWNYSTMVNSSLTRTKSLNSYESFSCQASIAIPWYGQNVELDDENNPVNRLSFSSEKFNLGQRFVIESSPRESATWPEENLPPPSKSSSPSPRNLVSSMRKLQNKFLNNAFQSSFSSNTWCSVIVTAGLDGRIRSFLNYGLPIPL